MGETHELLCRGRALVGGQIGSGGFPRSSLFRPHTRRVTVACRPVGKANERGHWRVLKAGLDGRLAEAGA